MLIIVFTLHIRPSHCLSNSPCFVPPLWPYSSLPKLCSASLLLLWCSKSMLYLYFFKLEMYLFPVSKKLSEMWSVAEFCSLSYMCLFFKLLDGYTLTLHYYSFTVCPTLDSLKALTSFQKELFVFNLPGQFLWQPTHM